MEVDNVNSYLYNDLRDYFTCFACAPNHNDWILYPRADHEYWDMVRQLQETMYNRTGISRSIEEDIMSGVNIYGYMKWSASFMSRIWNTNYTRGEDGPEKYWYNYNMLDSVSELKLNRPTTQFDHCGIQNIFYNEIKNRTNPETGEEYWQEEPKMSRNFTDVLTFMEWYEITHMDENFGIILMDDVATNQTDVYKYFFSEEN